MHGWANGRKLTAMLIVILSLCSWNDTPPLKDFTFAPDIKE